MLVLKPVSEAGSQWFDSTLGSFIPGDSVLVLKSVFEAERQWFDSTTRNCIMWAWKVRYAKHAVPISRYRLLSEQLQVGGVNVKTVGDPTTRNFMPMILTEGCK